MTKTPHIPEIFLGIGFTRHRAGLPLEGVRIPVPKPADDQVLVRVAASSLNPLEYKLANLNSWDGRPPSFWASICRGSWWPPEVRCAVCGSATR